MKDKIKIFGKKFLRMNREGEVNKDRKKDASKYWAIPHYLDRYNHYELVASH